jgi:hypothetical protein
LRFFFEFFYLGKFKFIFETNYVPVVKTCLPALHYFPSTCVWNKHISPAGTWPSGTHVLGQEPWSKLNKATDLFTYNFPYPKKLDGEFPIPLFQTKQNSA